jgi:hypothetical protein
LTFPYIWLGLILLLVSMYGINFFGQSISGDLVALGTCCALASPLIPGLVSNFAARPLFLNLIMRDVFSGSGCLLGLLGFVLTWLSVLFFVTRSFQTAVVLFALAPVLGLGLAFIITTIGRSGGGRRSAATGGRSIISKPPSQDRQLLGGSTGRKQLPPGKEPGHRAEETRGRVSRPRKRG